MAINYGPIPDDTILTVHTSANTNAAATLRLEVSRCGVCMAYVDSGDMATHRSFHDQIEALQAAIVTLAAKDMGAIAGLLVDELLD